MTSCDFSTLIQKQRDYFATGATLPIEFRIEQLKKLKSILKNHQDDIVNALYQDLHRARIETVIAEVVLVTNEIDTIIKNLKKWTRPQKVSTTLAFLPGRSEIHFEPYGCVLIIGPWNYPLLLTFSPLIGAIAAGNCALIKPSEFATHAQALIIKLINDNFDPAFIHAIAADREETERLLQERFDYIFFTGGVQIGKAIMAAAAKHLTPLTLELGGKNPCVIDQTANLDFAARRILLAKLVNTGQTCTAPDFLYVQRSCKDALVKALQQNLKTFLGADPENSQSYGRIINKNHFLRLVNLMKSGRILIGGKTNENTLYIEPTVIDNVTWDDPIMQEEVFGPLLPILTFDNPQEVLDILKTKEKPLAFYLFTNDKHLQNEFINRYSFGGGCINDCLTQLLNYHLPFGGVGQSGFGKYHNKFSFETFSHRKSIFKKTLLFEAKIDYPPYTKRKFWWIKQLLKL